MSVLEPAVTPRTPTIRVGSGLLAALERRAATAYPHTACGLLLGRLEGEELRICRVTSSPLESRVVTAARDAAGRAGLRLVGTWQSRPDLHARPSREGHRATGDELPHLLLSVGSQGVSDIRAWRGGGRREVELPIREIVS